MPEIKPKVLCKRLNDIKGYRASTVLVIPPSDDMVIRSNTILRNDKERLDQRIYDALTQGNAIELDYKYLLYKWYFDLDDDDVNVLYDYTETLNKFRYHITTYVYIQMPDWKRPIVVTIPMFIPFTKVKFDGIASHVFDIQDEPSYMYDSWSDVPSCTSTDSWDRADNEHDARIEQEIQDRYPSHRSLRRR
jgi:hypothetical protein